MSQQETTPITPAIFNPIKDKFLKITNEATFLREVSFATQLVNSSKQLKNCSAESIIKAVMNIANIGLSLNPAKKEAYLVPRYSSITRGMEACLEPSYQGLVKLLNESGSVSNIYAYPVFEGDTFEPEMGTHPKIKHIPRYQSKEVQFVYAVAIFPDNRMQIEVMQREEIDEIRDMSESYKAFKDQKISSCVWNDHYNEMARKTVIRRIVKYLPKTAKFDKVAEAISLDEDDYRASFDQITQIEILLGSPLNITPERERWIHRNFEHFNKAQASEVITELLNAQVDPVDSGHRYNQTDIQKNLNKLKS